MQQKRERELLLKYLEHACSESELKEVMQYLANAEYPDRLDSVLEEEWLKFKSPQADDELADRLLQKFNKKKIAKR